MKTKQRKQGTEAMVFERLFSMKDVRDILGVSYGVIYGLIESGKLRAVKITGEPVPKEFIDHSIQGLRFYPSDLRQFLTDQTIK